ncbi:hypothetical protein CY34DRAFT_99512, partial [Suillus luteus UH-Slu-Lm8-n1]
CYLMWIEDIGDATTFKHWTNHFTTLSKDDTVRKNFRAIIEFDVKTHQNYTLCPHQHDQAEWNHCLTKKKYDTMQKFMYRTKEHMSHSSTQSSSSCFELYNKDAKRYTKKSSDGDNSFRDGKATKSTDPMCIICGCTGHHFSDYTQETS